MTTFHLDYESRSEIDLDRFGLDRYVKSPTTSVLMAAYAEGDHKPKLWEPHLGPMPNELRDALTDPWVEFHAWNVPFEKQITKHVLGIDKPIQDWRDVMVMARYLSLPGSLEAAGEILGLKPNESKLESGKKLIRLFCEPETEGGHQTLFGPSKATFRDWRTHPKEWELFGEYCKQDVIAERAIEKKLRKFPLPDFEWETWYLDAKINSTGLPVDAALVAGARVITDREMDNLIAQLKTLTGCDNPNSTDQILAWLQTQGYGFTSLGKAFVARAMGGECDLTDAARTALEIRSQTAKSSVKKYTAIADTVSADGRLRNAYQFLGAARTGRWSSLGVNVANLPRPTKQVEKNLNRAVELVQLMDYDGIVREFGKPLDVVASTIRSSFRAPEGFKFVVADLASIEARGLCFLAKSKTMLKMFNSKFHYKGKDYPVDPYLDFATRMYKQSYEELWVEWKEKGDSTKRNNSKPPVLGAGYMLGPGDENIDKETGVKTWEGLMGYARAVCGVEMSKEDAILGIRVYREAYPEVKQLWYGMMRAAAYAIRHPGKESGVGKEYPLIYFICHGTKVLEMRLPSGRSLHYIDPRVVEVPVTHDYKTLLPLDKPYVRDEITYQGKEQGKPAWGSIPTHGGKLVENADQSISRDVLVHGMKLADAAGFEIVGSTYDEIITIVPENSPLGVDELCACMTNAPAWCGDAFPLGAEGFEDKVYRKN